jgi:hypothetical protein
MTVRNKELFKVSVKSGIIYFTTPKDIRLTVYRHPFLYTLFNSHFTLIINNNPDGHLHYPNDTDKSLNEATADKKRKYRPDYTKNPPSAVSLMSDIASTSGRLHSEFIGLLFVRTHRETDRFFTASGVHLP